MTSLPRFLDFDKHDLRKKYLHDFEFPTQNFVSAMHYNTKDHLWELAYMMTFYRYLTLFFRQTLLSKGGNDQRVLSYNQDIILYFHPKSKYTFSCFDLIWREIINISWDHSSPSLSTLLSSNPPLFVSVSW